jgi:hypothetical protein
VDRKKVFILKVVFDVELPLQNNKAIILDVGGKKHKIRSKFSSRQNIKKLDVVYSIYIRKALKGQCHEIFCFWFFS